MLSAPFPPQPTHDEIEAEFGVWPSIRNSIDVRRWCRRLLTPSTIVFFHFVFSRIDADAANRFFTQVSRGEGLARGMPTYILREKLLEQQRDKSYHTTREVHALVIKSRNAFIEGRQLVRLSWSPLEPFPEVSNPHRRPLPRKERP